ncbi:glycoside hydrolase family 2 TIM barrel-domain containing protein [Mariniflexile litorale]|uniref:Glycoside hydrolase family 2 TIM barrel-domain containing protein n=1 Tax=Mariniflexile litorale TaxID=3045158 RepID=A0AAU7EBA0_9FLAO|nr:glycoside hydrolase family 2 TIM barrel-domain containing protein [Mariniflexile sp. KMM 9835]MDQ8212114.1 glycoside hydrolase family 2 TIM barrel-domain containing protein [Mariniflexile sp. KMM 9835]
MKSTIFFKTKYITIAALCIVYSLKNFSQQTIINSGWQFSENQTTWETVNLPHTWNLLDAFDDKPGYRQGFGYYKKQVFIPSEEKNNIHYLKFNAVNQEAIVFVNGQKIGNHKGGYTAFNFDISAFVNYDAYNLIEVTVDNSYNENIPPLDADFTFYGGIYRDVELISLPKQHFSLDDFASDGFYINYYNISEEKAGVELTSILNNKASINLKTKLRLDLFDAEGNVAKTRTETLKLPAETSNEFKIKLPEVYSPKLWSPETPYLYQLKLVLMDENEHILDSKSVNIGFRWASIDAEKGFFLNGKPIKLIGVNRHQDYEGYGNAVPLELQKKDIQLIKEMGANLLRNAHYPQSRELYEMCDKLGILVWTEIPVVNKVTDSEAFFDICINMQKEHIKQYYNYPSVVMFGYMNEIFLRLAFDNKSTLEEKNQLKKASLKLANHLENLTRKLAPNHITVMACHLNDVYNETGIADIPMLLGWNLYFGWYDKDIPDLGDFLDDQHKRYPKRSLLLSEYGPGADVRVYTRTPKKFDFSTEYQAKLHQSYFQQIIERPFMTGMTAWNFADFGSEFRGDAIPHVNQKGLVNYDRTPKEIYYWYKSVLDKNRPFLHIATHYLSGLTLFGNETYPIQIYSNQKTASVFLNDKKFEDIIFNEGFETINMLFVNGINQIKVISEGVSDTKNVEVLRIDALDFNNFNRLGINMGSHFYFTDETKGITFVPDQPYIKGWYGYANGEPFGMSKDKNQGIPHDIKNSTSEPLFQTMLEGCTSYKIDVPKGKYKVSLYFVEPQIKPIDNIYNLSKTSTETDVKNQRIFDVYLNDKLIQKQFNMAKEYHEKYGITITNNINVNRNEGLTISLQPIEGRPVISGVLIEKLD